MFRLRGSHGLPRTAPTPRTFQLLGCGQGEDSDPAAFFVLSQRKNTEETEIVGNHFLFVQCVLLAMSHPPLSPMSAPPNQNPLYL